MSRLRAWLVNRGTLGPQRVLSLQRRGDVRAEGEERRSALREAQRIALVAHWDPEGRVSRSTEELLACLLEHAFETVLVSAAGGSGALRWPGARPPEVTVLRRPNFGYDFGSWATALKRYPHVRACPAVLLLNDSLLGPFASLRPLLDHFLATEATIWGMTSSAQFVPHVQSYALGFRGGALDLPRLRRFWKGIRVEIDKENTVMNNEITLSRLVAEMGLSMEVAFPWQEVMGSPANPTLHGWRRLLEMGFPFVKRMLVHNPEVGSDAGEVEEAVARRFGVRLADWV